MELTNEQRQMLKPYEKILQKMCFNAKQPCFVDYNKSEELANIYSEITGKPMDCKGCDGKVWIKRLSYWYCGNRDGVLPVDIEETKPTEPVKRQSRKPKTPKK